MLIGYPAIPRLLSTERVPHSTELHANDTRTAQLDPRPGNPGPIFNLLLDGTLAPPFIGTTIFFEQDYLITLRGYDPLVFAAAFPMMSASTMVFGLVCGQLVDRPGALRRLPFFLIPLAIASATVGLINPVWGIYLFVFLLGISNGFTQTLLGALWPEVYGVTNLGGIRAIIASAMVLSTAIGPGISGALIDLGIGLPTQMLWRASWCVAASFSLGAAARIVASREAKRGPGAEQVRPH